MQFNQHIEKMARPWSSAKMLAVVFGVAVVLATGCSSTGGGVKAGLITPVINSQQGTVPENNDLSPTTTESRI
jgi:hypothetical protein